MGKRTTGGERAISPVVGGVLLIGIVLLLATVTGVLFTGLLDTESPAPTARLTLDPAGNGCQYELTHEGGERIEGNATKLVGVDDPDALGGTRLTTGETVRVRPTDDTVRVVWQVDDTREYQIAKKSIDDEAGDTPIWKCSDGTVYTGSSSGINAVNGADGKVVPLSTPGNVEGLGPTRIDLTGDGSRDTPYVDDNGRIRITNETNSSTTLATDIDFSGSIGYEKTRLWAGTWNGSDPSVFFVDEDNEEIYRVNRTGPPVEVAAPDNDAQAVVGTGDIDGDGTDELVFADGSQQLRYLEASGSIKNVAGGQTGSNNGIGSGSLVDFNGDGAESAVVVDGSNDVKITSETKTTTVSIGDAAKTPPTVANVDDDGKQEVVYVSTGEKLKYIDDVEGSNDVNFLRDEDGNKIDGSDSTGTG